jgi:hypothetical protein
VVSEADPYGRNVDFLDRQIRRYTNVKSPDENW